MQPLTWLVDWATAPAQLLRVWASAAAADRGFQGPLYLRLRPAPDPKVHHAPPHSGSPCDLARQRLERPGHSASAKGLGLTLRGDGGGRHQKAWRVPGNGNPSPGQTDDKSQSAGAPPVSASPPTPWAVQPRSRGGLWVSRRLAELQREEVVVASPLDYAARQKLQFPAASGASDGSR